MEYLHNQEHAREDAAAAVAAKAAGLPDPSHDTHDETNCEIHAQLHLPFIAVGWTPLLVLLGLFVAFLTLLAPAMPMRPIPSRLVCRGPPAR